MNVTLQSNGEGEGQDTRQGQDMTKQVNLNWPKGEATRQDMTFMKGKMQNGEATRQDMPQAKTLVLSMYESERGDDWSW